MMKESSIDHLYYSEFKLETKFITLRREGVRYRSFDILLGHPSSAVWRILEYHRERDNFSSNICVSNWINESTTTD